MEDRAMAKERSPAKDYLVYLVVRSLVHFLQCLSPAVGRSFARTLAWIAYHIDRRHRQVALDNLRRAFPGRHSEAQLDEMVREVYRHFCTVMVEMVHLPRKLHAHNWRRHIQLEGGPVLVEALLSGEPLLIVTGHFGNWELAGYVLGLLGFRSFAVARPIDNPYLDRFLRQFRERTGQKLLAKKGELDMIQDVLEHGGIICTLADQDAGRNGMYVDFFGQPASTHKAIALLALQHHATLMVCGAVKTGEPMQYTVRVMDVIRPDEYQHSPRAVRAMTERFTTALEKLVRLDPAQYFWLHRRWKHQPQQRVRRAA
jgi:KDO2-lipid IV(A) lauroyltransferase